jgi:Na+-transporting methylmalonyl-CoA/oxaloacetate decarboxylase gamma subunit
MTHIMRRLSIRFAVLLAFLFSAQSLSAQAIKDIRINEIQVYNTDGYEDDYGHRNGWIELFNSGYSQVNIGGAYLKARNVDGTITTYRIPKNDRRTVMAPQGYLIFFAEGTASKGTFHTNFRMEDSNMVLFYDQSGKGAAIDSISYNPATMEANKSFGWLDEQQAPVVLQETTPMATNDTVEKTPRSEIFRRADPYGIVMAITAMSVVFVALIMLYLIFRTIGKHFSRIASGKKEKEVATATPMAAAAKVETESISGDELAAIAVALYKYSEDLHDMEHAVLTINRVTKAYSPWSSKIYGLRPVPNKK